MSFGYRDADWVDPPEEQDPPCACDRCAFGREVPGLANLYYCVANDEFYEPDYDETCVDWRQ